jgi:chemotaxis protein MotB
MYSKRKKTYERHNIWRSYADMLSGLLLLFILVMCISFMQAQKNYQDRLAEEAAHQLTQEQLLEELAAREDEVASQQSTLDEQNALLASQQEDIDSQSALLAQQEEDLAAQSALVARQQADLESQSAVVAQQQSELDEKNSLMAQQQAALDEQEQLMAAQQQKIEQIIGVKADLISALKEEFDARNLAVTIDDTDGSITLDSNVLFGYNENELTEEGNTMLSEVLPIYCKVLLDEEYQDYLAEIRIDGYTDTDGDYLYNLQLSQERALAVANYLMSSADSFLSSEELTYLKGKLTANGHSMSNPVYTADGAIDKDASRRVEIKFSLKDEEMINEMKEILAGTATD